MMQQTVATHMAGYVIRITITSQSMCVSGCVGTGLIRSDRQGWVSNGGKVCRYGRFQQASDSPI